jgi:hypothetical protein
MPISIIFIHSGDASPPACMVDSIAISCQIATRSNIIALLNQNNLIRLHDRLKDKCQSIPPNLQFVSIESLAHQDLSAHFLLNSKADKKFRKGFWLQTANRFMLIADLMESLSLSNCLHLENDNVLYFDPTEKIAIFRNHARFAIPFDRSRAIPGIVWYKDAEIAKELAKFINERSEAPDFDVIRTFCDSGLYDAKPLPTMNLGYANLHKLSASKYCDGHDQFGGIFDAAAIGQYIGGVDPRNIPGDSRFFINETSDLNMDECSLRWEYDGARRKLLLEMCGEEVTVLSVHMHCKDSLGASPFNKANISDEKFVVTGERLQELAELTITSREVTAYHGINKIRTRKVLEIPEKNKTKFFRKKTIQVAPDEQWMDVCKSVRTIFVYTHLLDYFKKYVLKRLESPFVLISHNSDDGIDFKHLEILNYPYLEKWYAQNCQISHSKLHALPIGITNMQWGAEKIKQLIKASNHHKKTKLVYANFSLATHPSRKELFDAVSSIETVSKNANLSYEEYLRELAQHKFCLCPRGNGIDTHRFWEAQYLNVIPIIVQSDWTQSYSGLPVLVLREWGQLNEIDLRKEYIKISSTYHDLRPLNLSCHNLN